MSLCPYCGSRDNLHIWAGEGHCPGINETVEKKTEHLEAEIQRLKLYETEVKTRTWNEMVLENELFKAKRLITELCDALEEEFGSLERQTALKDKYPWNLIQRARDALNINHCSQ